MMNYSLNRKKRYKIYPKGFPSHRLLTTICTSWMHRCSLPMGLWGTCAHGGALVGGGGRLPSPAVFQGQPPCRLRIVDKDTNRTEFKSENKVPQTSGKKPP